MAYPTSINAAPVTSNIQRAGKRVFSPSAGTDRFVLSVVFTSEMQVRMWKSTDSGVTWTALDTANEPHIESSIGEMQFDAIQDPSDSTKVIVAWVAPRASSSSGGVTYLGEYCINTFDMVAGAWGTRSTGGPGAASSATTAYAAEDYVGIYFNVCKDPADGSCWLSYLTLVDASTADPILGVGSFLMRPAIRQLSSGGSWGSEIVMMPEPTVLANCKPNGICIGDSSRVHVVATQYTMTDIAGYAPINDWVSVFHQSYLGGIFGAVQLVKDQVYADTHFENTVSPLATRTVSGSTEMLFGYGLAGGSTPPNSNDASLVTQYVARAISATDPTWTLQALPGIVNTGNEETPFTWSAPVTLGTRLIAYSNFYASNLHSVRVNQYSAGAWSSATELFAAPLSKSTYGETALLTLLDGGFIGAVLTGSSNSEDYYYEIAVPPVSVARTYVWSS